MGITTRPSLPISFEPDTQLGIKQNLRDFDGRYPFGSKHRSKPIDLETAQSAIEAPAPPQRAYGKGGNVHKSKMYG